MKTFNECCQEVAEKNKLSFSGSNFYYIDDSITSVGNPLKFFEEAAEMYAKEVALEFYHYMNLEVDNTPITKNIMNDYVESFDQFRKEIWV